MGTIYSELQECWNLFNYNLRIPGQTTALLPKMMPTWNESNVVGWHCFCLRLGKQCPPTSSWREKRKGQRHRSLGCLSLFRTYSQNRKRKSLAKNPKFCHILTMLVTVQTNTRKIKIGTTGGRHTKNYSSWLLILNGLAKVYLSKTNLGNKLDNANPHEKTEAILIKES